MSDRSLPAASEEEAKTERNVRWVYIWLLLSSFITVPLLNMGLPHQPSDRYYANEHPTWSPDGRFIAFTSDRDGNDEIYVMNSDGTNIRNLTQNRATDNDPAWSPDGSLIAFSSNREGKFGIFTMTPDGRNTRRLTVQTEGDENPSWSPDGKSIAFYSNRDGNREIYVMDAFGSNQRNLTRHSASDESPAWSPDGKYIAFASNRAGNWEIYVMNSDGSNPWNLTNNRAVDESPAWSPDGKSIAFSSTRETERGIYVMDADGKNPRRLGKVVANAPAWSPDGKQIAFGNRAYDDKSIYVINTAGTGLKKLTENVIKAPLVPIWSFALAALAPTLIHVILLVTLFGSSNLFVRRHTQQALVLVGLRALTTLWLVGLTREPNWNSWILVNGSLWLFGSLFGIRQVNFGDCWLMRLRGEGSLLPRPWATMPKLPVRERSYPWESDAELPRPKATATGLPARAVVERLLEQFRSGSPEERQTALGELEKLGQVEKF